MADNNDTAEVIVDTDKETLMEVRGIIDGCLDSGSKDYNGALQQIHSLVAGEKDSLVRSQCKGGILTFTKG